MQIEFNRTGAERKALVQAMGEILDVKPKYLGMPTTAYEIGDFRIDKNGAVECDDRVDDKEIKSLLEKLADRGIAAAPTKTVLKAATTEPQEATENNVPPSETEPQEATVGLMVELPLDMVQVGNLTKILDAKGGLIKKALGVENLRFEIRDDRIAFPWFDEVDADSAKAYTHFISALCHMAKNAKRVTVKEKETENEKYAFRCFLLRLGFIGPDYKTERKILLKNLKGSSAFKDGRREVPD